MKLVLEILPHHDDEQPVHQVIKKFPATVGRGFQNDVILTDPHVSPVHLRIDAGEKNWVIGDLDSANGVFVNDVRQRGEKIQVRSGDVVLIGQTKLRFYAPDHPVTDTIRIQKLHPAFLWISRPLHAGLCFALAAAAVQGWSYFEVWTEETGLTLAAAATATIGAVAVWAALWSVAGRLIRRKSHFRSHAALACLYLIAGIMGWYVETYADFLANGNWLSQTVTYGINFIFLGFLFYGSFALATRMPERQRVISALSLSSGIIGGIFVLGLVGAKNFNQQPLYPSTLEPYLSGLAPAYTVNDFMTGNEKLFSSKEFKEPQPTSQIRR